VVALSCRDESFARKDHVVTSTCRMCNRRSGDRGCSSATSCEYINCFLNFLLKCTECLNRILESVINLLLRYLFIMLQYFGMLRVSAATVAAYVALKL
jgi:hypothetical protein